MSTADPLTLLLAIVLIFFVGGVVWVALAWGARLAPQASMYLAGANAMLAGSLGAHALRGSAPDWLSFWGSDAMAIAGLAMLRAAVPLISGQAMAWRSALAVLLPAAAALAAMPYQGSMVWHSRLVYLALSLLTLMSGLDILRHLREQVKPVIAGLLALPLGLLFVLLAARLAESLLAPGVTPELRMANEFNIVWLWSSLVMGMVLNASMACLILMRLVLRIQRLTQRDPLTDAWNRRALSEAIEMEHLRLQRGMPYSLVMIDMDRFKQLNDSLGHAAGDAALQKLVQVLAPSVRDVDRLGRLGGEEFCVLLPLTGMVGATLVAERMRLNLEECEFSWHGQAWPLTASFGIAEATAEDASADAVLGRADQAMYAAKSQGRNAVQVSGA